MFRFKKVLLGTAAFALSFQLFSSTSFAASVTTGTVTTSVLNIRSGPGTNYEATGVLDGGRSFTVLGTKQNWLKIKSGNGFIGWVRSDFVKLNKTTVKQTAAVRKTTTAKKTTTAVRNTAPKAVTLADRGETTRADSLSEDIVQYAKKFLGVPYVWGGNTPDGFDCSGFVKYVYSKFGIDIHRVAADQAKDGSPVSMDNLKPGDLVFFDTNGGFNYINHVGMYIGDGKFIQESSGSGEVVISDLTKGFYANCLMTARSFL